MDKDGISKVVRRLDRIRGRYTRNGLAWQIITNAIFELSWLRQKERDRAEAEGRRREAKLQTKQERFECIGCEWRKPEPCVYCIKALVKHRQEMNRAVRERKYIKNIQQANREIKAERQAQARADLGKDKEQQRCRTCRFYVDGAEVTQSHCRRNAPTMKHESSGWPSVFDSSWCGEYQASKVEVKRCRTCRWFDPSSIDKGICRKQAPRDGKWHLQFAGDWCGKHEVK